MSERTIILASASPRRHELLARWGVPFRALPAAGVDESTVSGEATHVAKELARLKAEWSREAAIEGGEDPRRLWVLGADTVVSLDGEILGKPRDDDHAREMLDRLAGRVHEVITGIAVSRPDGASGGAGRTLVAHESTRVRFVDASPVDIDAYVRSGDAAGKAGAYGIQSAGARLVAGFEGCYYNVVGLPVKLALRMLEVATPPDCDCEEVCERFSPGGAAKTSAPPRRDSS